MTAHQLHARLLAAGCTPSLEGGGLVIDDDPPKPLADALAILHTGVRAVLSGKAWFGSTGEARKKPRILELDAAKVIAADIDLLCVAGDEEWDRISQWLRPDVPELFEQEKTR